MNEPFYIHRSGFETYQRCKRNYYLGYLWGKGKELQGKIHEGGLAPVSSSIYLTAGSAIHAGVEQGLLGMDEDAAVRSAMQEFVQECGKGWMEEQREQWDYLTQETLCMTEVCTRVAHRILIPQILAGWDVVLTEKEERVDLGEGQILLGRLDAVLRDKSALDESLDVFSLKTASAVGEQKILSMQMDNQGLSESYLLEQRFNQPAGKVLIAFIVKGQRKKDSDGVKRLNNGIIRPWTDGVTWAYKYSPKYNGAAWERKLASDYPGGIKAWLDQIPKEALEEMIVVPDPLVRQKWQQKEFIQTLKLEMADAEERCTMVEKWDGSWDSAKVHYPMTRTNCVRMGGVCEFAPLCHGNEWMGQDPMGTGLYQLRTPHHPEGED